MLTPAPLWGEQVTTTSWDGHPGLAYEPRPRSLVALLDDCDRFGDRVFVVQGDRRVTFAEFRAAATRAARLLQSHGVEPGSRVMIWAHNSPSWVLALWSTWVGGAVPVLGNRWWTDPELASAIERSAAAVVITDAPDRIPAGTVSVSMVALDDLWDHGESDTGRLVPFDIDEHDEAMILFTSGSTGAPKGVVLSHRSVIANQHNLLLASRRLPHQQKPDSAPTVSLATVPTFHIGGVTGVITQVVAGGRIVFLRGRFDPGEVLKLIEAERVTTWGGVPTMALRVLDHADFERRDLSSLRSFPLGGAPLPEPLLQRLIARLPHVARGLGNTWGLSESGGFLTSARGDDLVNFPGTSGRPYPVVEIAVDDPDPDGNGELLVRSPTNMSGYLGVDPFSPECPLNPDGWLHTGDVGRLDDAGRVYVTGRSKDVVIRGGENVATPHVESHLLGHRSVIEVAVFGLPHDELGEEVAATVVTCDPTLTASMLRAYLEPLLAYFEIPTRWQLRSAALPTLPTGKVDKHQLRREHLDSADGG